MEKVIITIVGKDHIGIIAKSCTFLASQNINILDITQSIIDGYFNMMMICDIQSVSESFETIQSKLHELGQSMNVDIKMQHTAIFESMHRI